MRNQLLRGVILQDVWMIDVLEFISSFVGVSLHAHHNERLEGVKYALFPLRNPVIVAGDDIMYDLIVGLAPEWIFCMIECVDYDTDVPQLTALLNYGLLVLLNLLR